MAKGRIRLKVVWVMFDGNVRVEERDERGSVAWR